MGTKLHINQGKRVLLPLILICFVNMAEEYKCINPVNWRTDATPVIICILLNKSEKFNNHSIFPAESFALLAFLRNFVAK